MSSDPLLNGGAPLATAPVSRRGFLQAAGAMGVMAGLDRLAPAYARPSAGLLAPSLPPGALGSAETLTGAAPIDLRIGEAAITVRDRRATAVAINGTVPGPLLRFREGEDVTINVINGLKEDTSIHWHGLIIPAPMDGVPGVSFPGIPAGTTFAYRLPIRQYGTYWYHSHSGLQEQVGHYGPMIIDPAEPEPFQYDREYVVMFSDWMFEDPYRVLDKLKKQATYSNFQRRTVGDFFRDVRRNGFKETVQDRWMWGRMRMSPTDISDVTAPVYTHLLNGRAPAANWTGLFRPGERVRLRFINAGAGSYFDVRIPGLAMTVVAASGQYVKPVTVDEIRVEIAQTYDVIVQPQEDIAYTIFAESMDRSGYARGTLAPRAGMSGSIPKQRRRPTLTMTDMGMSMAGHGGMAGMGGMSGHNMGGSGGQASGANASGGDMPGMNMGGAQPAPAAGAHAGHDMGGMQQPAQSGAGAQAGAGQSMAGHDMGGMAEAAPRPPAPADMRLSDGTLVRTRGLRPPGTLPEPTTHAPGKHGVANQMTPDLTRSRLNEPGPGLGEDGWRVLTYTDLRALKPFPEATRPPVRELELHLTGNMERYMWSINGVKYSDVSEPLRLTQGESVRITMVNDTMMAHPMHIHGMWMLLENGHGPEIPRLHTVNVKGGERVSFLAVPEDLGPWAFHCHVLYHMEMGMFRVVEVVEPGRTPPVAAQGAHQGLHKEDE